MRWAWLALVLIVAAGCGEDPPPPAEFQVGTHRVQMQIPEGWEHVNYGERHQLRRDLTRVSLERIKWRGKNFDAAVSNGLKNLKEDSRREEASRDTLTLGGQKAVLVETWDRVSHQWPKRFLFVWTGQDFVVAYTMAGTVEEAAPVFDALLGSFALADTLQAVE